MRSSVIFLGALLARCGEVRLSMPGGCELGPRPIDLHLMALHDLGAEITEENGDIVARAKKLKGARIEFPSPSVGATENALLAACAAEGVTIISNAAREPEIEDLQSFLIAMGAKVSGAGTSTIVVEGFSPVRRVGHRIMPDRIAASTLLCATASVGGDIELRGVEQRHFETVLRSLSECGCDIITTSRSVRLSSNGRLQAPQPIVTGPFPAFPTDAQPLLLSACLKAAGTSVFVEKVFSNRYRYVSELRRLGAKVYTEGSVAVVTGVSKLQGAPTTATDLRGGAALVIAGLSAEGETEIIDSGHIMRGYDALDARLRDLGAELWITKD
jgi:UDP-N-acetylglucosamine 1-carboxyvinyltransferase